MLWFVIISLISLFHGIYLFCCYYCMYISDYVLLQGIDEDSKLSLSDEQLESLLMYIMKEAALYCRDDFRPLNPV